MDAAELEQAGGGERVTYDGWHAPRKCRLMRCTKKDQAHWHWHMRGYWETMVDDLKPTARKADGEDP